MPKRPHSPLPLSGWTVLSLRPRGQHAGLRAGCARNGARTLALSVLSIRRFGDAATRKTLATTLRADIVLLTSPNAVRAAAALHRFKPRRGQRWLAVGAGTQRALQRLGIEAQAPARMDSEGLLALPELADVDGKRVGLITGGSGRGLLEPALRARGAEVVRGNLYAREAVPLAPKQRLALHAALADPKHVLLALTSAEALQELLAQVDVRQLRSVAVVAASPRLAEIARAAGFTRMACAASARPAALLKAAIDTFA